MGTVHAKERQGQEPVHRRVDNNTDHLHHRKYELEGIPARVDRINVSGLGRTKDDFVKDTVKDLFEAQDLQDVVLRAYNVRQQLSALECFRSVGVVIDTSSTTPHGLEVTFHVRELRRVVGGINTTVGNNEGALVLGMKCPNVLGRGERVQTELTFGHKRSNNCSLQLLKPLVGSRRTVLSASAYQAMSEWPASGYRLLERGLILDASLQSLSALRHTLQLDTAIRDLSVLSCTTAFAVREQSGPSLRCSLRHILSMDSRDEGAFPTVGQLLRLTSELAGLGGDVGYLKNELHGQLNVPLAGDAAVLQASAQLGVLAPAGQDKHLILADQFFLGGPLSLRGFQNRGVGPHADGNALGSDVYWSAGLHLFTPLPFTPGKGGLGDLFRMHFFLNAGNVGHIKMDNLGETLEDLQRNVRMSYGVGLAARIGSSARLELNYCFPAAYQRGDQLQPGVQFGIGMHFL